MRFRVLALAAVFALLSSQAGACRYQQRPFDDALNDAKTAFVGTVRTVENGLATIVAEKGIKGIEDGQEIDTEIGQTICDIRFEPGQRWIYLGAAHPSGSLLLQDEYGRIVKENLDLAQKKFGPLPDDGAEVAHGALRPECTADGPSVGITLDNGMSAQIFEKLDALPEGSAIASYAAVQKGRAVILRCPRPKDGQAENLPCRSMIGTVFLGRPTQDEAVGAIETQEGEYHSRTVFRVNIDRSSSAAGISCRANVP